MEVKRLFSFDGRVGRGAFWGIDLLASSLLVVAAMVATGGHNALLTLLAFVLLLATMVVGVATSVKRWHDRGKSGSWYFISLIPIVGPIWALVELGFLPGTPGDNRYGAPDSGSPFVGEPLPAEATTY